MKSASKYLIVLIAAVLFVSPITASASTLAISKDNNQQQDVLNPTKYTDDAQVSPNALPAILIGLAIRALWRLGLQELARYLADKGIDAYCSKYGNSGPKFVSDLICK